MLRTSRITLRSSSILWRSSSSLNPLLEGQLLPAFSKIEPCHVEGAMQVHLDTAKQGLDSLINSVSKDKDPKYDEIFKTIETVFDPLGSSFGIVSHLMSVRNSDALRDSYTKVQPKVIELTTSLYQNTDVFKAVANIRGKKDTLGLSETQMRVIDGFYKQSMLKGVGLDQERRERFKELSMQHAKVCNDFSNNVLDSTKEFSLILKDKSDVEGLPESLLQLTSHAAKAEYPDATPEAGPWKITLDGAVYPAFMKNCASRELRKVIYSAYSTRASEGKFSNLKLIGEILYLKSEMAKMLGFNNYTEMSLQTKMAPSVDAVVSMIHELRDKSKASAIKELDELKDFARSQGFREEWQIWDTSYWGNKYEKHKYGIDEETLRQYFPFPTVLEGFFNLVENLFNVRMAEAPPNSVDVWHPDVKYYQVFDRSTNQEVAGFYLDPYSRPSEKRGGAWMNSLNDRTKNEKLVPAGSSVKKPIAYLICNQMPPVDGQPSLMSFNEVTTLMHEFGHGLQHMLTTVDDGNVSGIQGIEWDAVEIPSQFMENFAMDPKVLKRISRHVKTHEPLPDDLIQKLKDGKNHMAAYMMMRQLQFAMLDIELHSIMFTKQDVENNIIPLQIQQKIASEYSVEKYVTSNRFICAFSHIFGGGYAAGYYSYKWAEVLAADAFSAFEDAGLENEAEIQRLGIKFRETILAQGGSQHPLTVFENFRGRPPQTGPLLKQYGLM